MARIRTIKPDFWDSPSVAQASLRARLLYIAMWNWADDFGIGDAHSGRLWNFAFPNDEPPEMLLSEDPADIPPTFRRVPVEYAEVANLFSVIFFEYEGRPYYYIKSWLDHQKIDRRSIQKIPFPDENAPRLFVDIPVPPKSQRIPPTSQRKKAVGTEELGTEELGTEELGTRNLSRETSNEISKKKISPEILTLCNHLADWIQRNGSKRPNITKTWTDECRRMIDIDGHSPDEIRRAIDWCQQDPFWRSNILSMKKLREKYDQMRLKAQGQQPPLSKADQIYLSELNRIKQQSTLEIEGGQE